MIVYLILNVVTFQGYVGQTIRKKFKYRYPRGEWYKKTKNRYLKNAAGKYGLNNFLVLILEENVESQEKLNELERYHIQQCRTLYPFGYNFEEGGNYHGARSKESIKKFSATVRAKNDLVYRFKSPTGEIFEPEILSDFCKEQGFASESHLIEVLRGFNYNGKTCHSYKGWTRVDSDYKKRKITFLSPNGEIFIFNNLHETFIDFAKKHNLKYERFGLLANGKISSYKGWVKIS